MKQKGQNSKFPKEIKTWRKNEPVPEWLSDVAKVSYIDEKTGKPGITTNGASSGGYEIVGSDGRTLLITKNQDDYVCCGDGRIFSLTKEQVELLYEEN